MSKADKAEQRAFDAYPVLMCYNDFQMVEEDINKSLREIYQEGYHQAEKDFQLTYDDICEIMEIREDVLEMDSYENLYEEILKRFKERKEK